MPPSFLASLKTRAQALGFDSAGVCGIEPSARGAEAYTDWLGRGMHAEMSYMARPDRVGRALDPTLTIPGGRSLVLVSEHYSTPYHGPSALDDPSRGRFAAYSFGPDYHDVMTPRLEALAVWIDETHGSGSSWRAYVDTGPILERDAGCRAGLGFVGRNTMLIDPRRGSWSFLGAIVTDAHIELTNDIGGVGTCGRCTRCIAACPTAAFPTDYQLDSRQCLSYLTIEHRGSIPMALRSNVGNRVFGCDVCNDVCPYNLRAAARTRTPFEGAGTPRAGGAALSERAALDAAPPLVELLALDDAGFADRFAGTAVSRAKRRGLLRNVCVAAGNWGSDRAAGPLIQLLADHEPLVRGHAAWALGQIGGRSARLALEGALRYETVDSVREEIRGALHA